MDKYEKIGLWVALAIVSGCLVTWGVLIWGAIKIIGALT